MEAMNRRQIPPLVMAVISGLLFALSFPNHSLYPLAWVALVPLMVAMQTGSVGRAAVLGFVTGVTGFSVIIYWLYFALYRGTASAVVAAAGFLAVCVYLGAYVAIWAAVTRTVGRHVTGWRLVVFAAALWVVLEYLRVRLLMAFTWGYLGYSQAALTGLIQIAAYTGVYGVSFVVALGNAAITDCVMTKRCKTMTVIAGITVILMLWGVWSLNNGAIASAAPVKIGVLQGNIELARRKDMPNVLATYKRLAAEAAREKPAVIVWPEVSLAGLIPDNRFLYSGVTELAQKTGAYHAIGALTRDEQLRLSNTSLLLGPDGTIGNRHRKTRLVIFVEYVPYRKYLERVSGFFKGIPEFYPGGGPDVFNAGTLAVGPVICSENFFGGTVRSIVQKGAALLVCQTNDEAYGRTSQPEQHFMINVLRAVENHRAVIIAANTGVSGVIDSSGRIVRRLPQFIEGFMVAEAVPERTMTFYTRHGDLFVGLCMLLVVLIPAISLWITRQKT